MVAVSCMLQAEDEVLCCSVELVGLYCLDTIVFINASIYANRGKRTGGDTVEEPGRGMKVRDR